MPRPRDSLIIRNVSLRDQPHPVDVALDGGAVASIERRIDWAAADEFEGAGRLLLGGFVNPHLHLDKCLLGRRITDRGHRTVRESIELSWYYKRSYSKADILARAREVLSQAIVYGTTAVRAFADVDTIAGLTGVEALLELKNTLRHELTLQVVAYPQEGIACDPGCADLMRRAMQLGADVVGGAPDKEGTLADSQWHVDFCIDLAKEFDADVHMLCDDTDSPLARSLEYLAIQTKSEGYEGRVVAGHCGALSAYDHSHAERVISLVREAGITVCSNPHVSLVLMGRDDRGLIRRGATRVPELIAAGVNVIAGQDDVDDPFYPFGKPDQLEVAQYVAHVFHFTTPSEFEAVLDMVTSNAARAMRLPLTGAKVGARADLVLIDAPSVGEALRLTPARRWVIYGGRTIAETKVETTLLSDHLRQPTRNKAQGNAGDDLRTR